MLAHWAAMSTGTLPAQLTGFVGREPELTAIAGALRDARLVTVVGPGGCGKTRLMHEAARREAERGPDEVRWVDLTATSDSLAVAELVAAAVGVLLAEDQDAIPSLARQIAHHQMLLCLDNCEHVLGGAAEVAVELVRACPGVTILATSRETLGVIGETVWRVPPLTGDDAVALFESRSARSTDIEQSRATVRTACARLDGIPLAIELAAAWSGTLSVQEILHGLDDRFTLLVRGPRGVAARHQTLAASMAWSHGLLTEADRLLFRRLGVLRGGFTLDAARGVCAFDGLGERAVLTGLAGLVDKSLVIADTGGSVARYRMLETIRQYAAAQLAASPELELVRHRHLDTFLAVAEAAAPLLDTDKDTWRTTIEAERENLRAALDWGLSADDPERGRRLAASLAWLWHLNGRGHEGLTVLRHAIDRGSAERTALQARLLAGLALVADTTRPMGLEYDAAQAALEIATEVGDEPTASLARLLSAVGVTYQGFDLAWSLAREARERAGEGFVADGAAALMGIIHHLRDEHVAAEPLLRSAVDGLTRRGDRGVAATAIGVMASGALYAGDLGRARELALEGVRVAQPLADYHRVGSAASVLATVETTAGRLDDAFAALDPIIRLVRGADIAPFVPGLARAMGQLRLRAGDPEDAIAWFRRETDWSEGADSHPAPQTLTLLAAALRRTGDTDTAAAACARALDSARQVGLPRVVADALEQHAFLVTPTDPGRAEDLHHEALALRAGHGLWLFCVDSLEALAALAARSESYAEAARLLAACDHARADMGYPRLSTLDSELLSVVGEEAYPAARSEGLGLSLPDAVDYARRARGSRGRPSSGWASLTPTEQSVVRLAAEGLNNPEIGTRLFMSRSTVKTHLSHVYAKLGVTNRTELATVASTHLTRQPTE